MVDEEEAKRRLEASVEFDRTASSIHRQVRILLTLARSVDVADGRDVLVKVDAFLTSVVDLLVDSAHQTERARLFGDDARSKRRPPMSHDPKKLTGAIRTVLEAADEPVRIRDLLRKIQQIRPGSGAPSIRAAVQNMYQRGEVVREGFACYRLTRAPREPYEPGED